VRSNPKAVTMTDKPSGPVLDHFSIGTSQLTDGWALFGRLLGGRWDSGDDSPGYWWGQLAFAGGPKIELLTPTGGPDAAFLERFLAARGAGPHHYNFLVPDIRATLDLVAALHITPVQVSLDNPGGKEAFLPARRAHGIVIQITEQAGPPESSGAPAALVTSEAKSTFALVEHHVLDLDGALRLFTTVLGGQLAAAMTTPEQADVTWPNGARIRLVRFPSPDSPGAAMTGAIHQLEFRREDSLEVDAAEIAQVNLLADRLGVLIRLL
jgi:catechol 2,3-dioxygenase-like lactoylglutathione lyase family enzyme